MYGKLVSNQFVPTQSGTVTTYEVTKSSLTQSIPNAASASSVTFIDYGTGTPTGQGVLDQVEIVSLDATRAGLGFTPIAAVGTTLSNGGSPGSTVRLQVNNAPIGFTAGAANGPGEGRTLPNHKGVSDFLKRSAKGTDVSVIDLG